MKEFLLFFAVITAIILIIKIVFIFIDMIWDKIIKKTK